MKKLIFALLALIMAVPATMTASESGSPAPSLEKQIAKMAKNEAKRLKKEGYKPITGALPLESQLVKAYTMKNEINEEGKEKYFFATSTAVGQTFDAAQQQANIVSRQDIAGQINTDVTSLIETTLANDQLTSSEAASIEKSLSKSQSFITNQLTGSVPVVQAYRELPNGNIEVTVTMSYSRANAMRAASNAIRKGLEEDIENFDQKLNLK